MKKVIKILGLTMVVSALLVISIGGVASAASGNQLGDDAPYRTGEPVGDCTCECPSEGECKCYCDVDGNKAGPLGNTYVTNYGEAGPHGE